MITRSPHPTSNFYMLDKAISEDKRLGWAARGLLVFLLGKPDNWTVSPAALVNETAKAMRGTGRDGVYAILKELKDAGYLRTVGARAEGGIFAGADYIVCESPHTEIPDTAEKPDTADLPDTAQPDTANPTQVRIEKKQGLKKKQGLSGADAPPAIPAELLSDFLAVRKAKKAGPLTPTALAGLQREADKAGVSLEVAVTACCEYGWQSFHAGWYAERNGAARGGASGETAYQRSMRERMQEAVPAIARKAPGAPAMQAVEFFNTVEAAPALRIGSLA